MAKLSGHDLGMAFAGVRPDRSDQRGQLEETIELTRRCRDAGFGYVVLGQHFLGAPLQYLHCVPALARLAPETGSMKLVTGVLLLSMTNAVDVADQLATLDVISGGRLIVGVGAGYRDQEFEAFGVDRRDRFPRMLESLAVMQELWRGGRVDFDGDFFQVHADGASLRPIQDPGPPIWLAAMADKSFERAMSRGLTPYLGPLVPREHVRAWAARYREATGRPDARLPVRRDLFLFGSRARAKEIADRYVGEKYDLYASQGIGRGLGQAGDLTRGYESRVIAGDAAECLEELQSYVEMGASPVILRCQWPSLPRADVEAMVAEIADAVGTAPSLAGR